MLVLEKSARFTDPVKIEPGRSPAFAELEHGVQAALETYSNVHRGFSHNGIVTTALLEQARDIVLDYLGLDDRAHAVLFCTPRGAELLEASLAPDNYYVLSSSNIGLPLGIRALAVESKVLPQGAPVQSGGGTVKLVSPNSVIWADAPDKFEAGTPGIVNAVAFAKALRVIRTYGSGIFQAQGEATLTAADILHRNEFLRYSGHELLVRLRKTMVGCNELVPTSEGVRPYTNLDNGASTPALSPVWDAVCQTWRQPEPVWGKLIGQVREICAGFLGAPLEEYDIIFVGNTTEAINLAARGFGNSERDTQPVVLNTLLEHNSNELPWRYIPGVHLIRLPLDDEGFVDLNRLEELLRDYNGEQTHDKQRIRMVAVSGASNVLGTCNDIREISQIAYRYGARILVDAAQLVGHR